MRGQWSTTCRWCTTGWAWCATNAMIAHQPHPTLSTAMAGRTVSNQVRKTLMNWFHQSNYQMRQIHLSQGSKWGVWMEWSLLGCPVGDTPAHQCSPGGEPADKTSPTNPHIPSPVFPHDSTRQLPATLELHKTKFKFDNKNN